MFRELVDGLWPACTEVRWAQVSGVSGVLPEPERMIENIHPVAMTDSLDARVVFVAATNGNLYRIDRQSLGFVGEPLALPVTATDISDMQMHCVSDNQPRRSLSGHQWRSTGIADDHRHTALGSINSKGGRENSHNMGAGLQLSGRRIDSGCPRKEPRCRVSFQRDIAAYYASDREHSCVQSRLSRTPRCNFGA